MVLYNLDPLELLNAQVQFYCKLVFYFSNPSLIKTHNRDEIV